MQLKMPNLLRKCENCVFGNETKIPGTVYCYPKLPIWQIHRMQNQQAYLNGTYVDNYTAADCDAFRLRDTGVNE